MRRSTFEIRSLYQSYNALLPAAFLWASVTVTFVSHLSLVVAGKSDRFRVSYCHRISSALISNTSLIHFIPISFRLCGRVCVWAIFPSLLPRFLLSRLRKRPSFPCSEQVKRPIEVNWCHYSYCSPENRYKARPALQCASI
jgi:hypothetical protein